MNNALTAADLAALKFFACDLTTHPFGSAAPSAEVEASLRARGLVKGAGELTNAGLSAIAPKLTKAVVMAALRTAYTESKAQAKVREASSGGMAGPYVVATINGVEIAKIRYGYCLRGINRFDSFKAIVGERKTGEWHRVAELDAMADHITGKRAWW